MAHMMAQLLICYNAIILYIQHLVDPQYCELAPTLKLPADVYIFHISMNHLDLEVKEQVFFRQHLNNKELKKEDHVFC
jgi:hypothetical protein